MCVCVAVNTEWRWCPTIPEHLLDKPRRRHSCFLLSHWPLHSISGTLEEPAKPCEQNTWQSKLTVQAGGSGLAQSLSVTPCCVHGCPTGSLGLDKAMHTTKRYVQFMGRSRSNYPEPKSGCVNNDNGGTIIMNNINSKYLSLLHAKQSFNHFMCI